MDSQTVTPRQALQHAMRALAEGQFDGRDVQGAQANALESIAWSLAGLLAERVETAPVRPAVRPPPHAEGHAAGRERSRLVLPLQG